jgi:methylenetetrahydrofolate reductase (NADPH)
MTRIIDKIHQRRRKRQALLQQASKTEPTKDGETFLPAGWYYSFEFFPPKTEPGLENLLTRIDRMTRRLDPLFIDVTWGSEGSTSVRTMTLASEAQRYFGVDVLMHLTTTGLTREQLVSILNQAKTCGVHNILALRGDPPRGKRSWGQNDVSGGYCDRAIDLVKLIRELHGDYFGIAIAGHPEGHPSSTSLEEEMRHLKEKLDAGADFIISQFFYSVPAFVEYVKQCRAHGITCPIMPGIMPIQSFSTFIRMTEYCAVEVPPSILRRLEVVKDDDEAVKAIGCEIAAEMCTEIMANKELDVDGVHFYTLNLERSVTTILMRMGAVDLIHPEVVKDESKHADILPADKAISSTADFLRTNVGRSLPWRPSALERRAKEEVRYVPVVGSLGFPVLNLSTFQI